VKVHDQVPVAETTELTVQVKVEAADQETVTELPLVYPFPSRVAELPTIPTVGETDTLGTTVKVVVPEFAEASVAVTVWAPWSAVGMVKEQLKLPNESVVAVHSVPAPEGDQVTVTAEAAAYPYP
jgi:hypothetical protein